MASQHEIAPPFHAEALKAVSGRLAGELRSMCDETEAAVLRELPGVAEQADATLRGRVIEATFRRVLALLGGEPGPDADAATHVASGAAARGQARNAASSRLVAGSRITVTCPRPGSTCSRLPGMSRQVCSNRATE